MVTIRGVAERAGVSQATASRVLTGSGPTSAQAQERVLQAAASLGYRVNKLARSLRTQRTDTVGLLIPDVRNPFFAELAHAIEQSAADRGLAVITMSADERGDRLAQALRTLSQQRVDGLIVVPQEGAGAAEELRNLPVIFVDREVDGPDVPVVRSDNADGARRMIDHLMRVGHREIALIAGPQSTSTGSQRLTAALARLAEHGCTPPAEWVLEGDFQLESGVKAAATLFSHRHRPTAIFAADNLMAIGALLEAQRRGLSVGRDVALTSFDDAPWFGVLDPPLTVIAQDVPALGIRALESLQSLIAGQPVPDALLPVHLVVRSSCGLPTLRNSRRRSS